MIRHQYAGALICLLMLILVFQSVAAQSQLAQDAYAIFEASCLNCHGPDGAFRETLLMEHSELLGEVRLFREIPMPPSCTSVFSDPPKTAHGCRSTCLNCPFNPLRSFGVGF